LAEASKSLRAAGGRVDHVLARVEHGPGTLNALVYGEDGAAALADARHAAAGVAAAADQLDHGPGLLHALLRDEAGAALVRDVAQLADRLNRISHDVERGRGTVGGLLVDPSVYEEMKTVLGNIERSVVFKALVRATIKNNGIARPAVQVEPAP
jgi:phospholipid/cholesterol/gamma-HCH transport system substrate-binding protein